MKHVRQCASMIEEIPQKSCIHSCVVCSLVSMWRWQNFVPDTAWCRYKTVVVSRLGSRKYLDVFSVLKLQSNACFSLMLFPLRSKLDPERWVDVLELAVPANWICYWARRWWLDGSKAKFANSCRTNDGAGCLSMEQASWWKRSHQSQRIWWRMKLPVTFSTKLHKPNCQLWRTGEFSVLHSVKSALK